MGHKVPSEYRNWRFFYCVIAQVLIFNFAPILSWYDNNSSSYAQINAANSRIAKISFIA